MRRIIIVLAILCLGACGAVHTEAEKESPFNSRYLDVYIDKETGCEYVVYTQTISQGGAGGITPRLNEEGMPICNKVKTYE